VTVKLISMSDNSIVKAWGPSVVTVKSVQKIPSDLLLLANEAGYQVVVDASDNLDRDSMSNAAVKLNNKKTTSFTSSTFKIMEKTPPVKIKQGKSVTMRPSDTLSLTTELVGFAKPGCIVQDTKVLYKWTLTEKGSQVTLGQTSSFTTFAIDASTLEAEKTYEATCTTSYQGVKNSEYDATIEVKVVGTPFAVKIKQGSTIEVNKAEGTLKLDAVAVDLDTFSKKSFEWEVRDKSGTKLTLVKPTAAQLSLSTSLLVAGSDPYTAIVTASKHGGKMTTNATTSISLTASVTPRVVLTQEGKASGSFNPSRVLVLSSRTTLLSALCASCTYKWSSTTLTEAQLTAAAAKGISGKHLLLKKNTLTAGQSYVFTLEATNAGATGTASVTVDVNSAPAAGATITEIQGNTEFDPDLVIYSATDTTARTGTLFSTEFIIAALDFTDSDSPLMYQYGFKKGSAAAKTTWLTGQTTSATYRTTKLPAGTLFPIIRVSDPHDAYTDKVSTYAVIIAAPVMEESDKSAYYKGQLDAMLVEADGDASVKADAILAIASSIKGARPATDAGKAADKEMRKAMSAQLTTMAATVDPLQIFAMTTDLADVSDPTLIADDTGDELGQVLETTMDRVAEISPDDAANLLTTFASLNKASLSGGRNGTDANNKGFELKKRLLKMSHLVAQTLAIGEEPATIVGGDITQVLKKSYSDDVMGEDVGGCVVNSAGAGTTLPDVVSHSIIQTKQPSIPYGGANNSAYVASDSFACQMLDTSGNKISMTNMDPPASVTVVASNNTGKSCSYMNEVTGNWDFDGVTMTSNSTSGNATTFKCDTTHFTDFAVQTFLAPVVPYSDVSNVSSVSNITGPNNESSTNWGKIIAVIFAILLLLCCCATTAILAFLSSKSKVNPYTPDDEAKSKVEPDAQVYPCTESEPEKPALSQKEEDRADLPPLGGPTSVPSMGDDMEFTRDPVWDKDPLPPITPHSESED